MGCDASCYCTQYFSCIFQSMYSYGVRLSASIDSVTERDISINALVWSATHAQCVRRWTHVHFNQRTRMECDRPCVRSATCLFTFQSTHSYGVRLMASNNTLYRQIISINALVWSATMLKRHRDFDKHISINALVWSATLTVYIIISANGHFNQRTRMECDKGR